jgi:DUF971 family protein
LSHNGFEIVNAKDVRPEEPELTGDAVRPAKVRVDKTGGSGMSVEWRDGHSSHWSFAWLRAACPCATCHEERQAAGRAPGAPRPKPATAFPLYEAPPRPNEVEPVGKYALRFKWNDGHEAGLYSWTYLRNVCDREAARQKPGAPA